MTDNIDEVPVTDLLSNEEPLYTREYGAAYLGDSSELLTSLPDNSIDLIVTSPPFALQHQKEYGNASLDEYNEWFLDNFAAEAHRVLQPHGSFVVEIGGSFQHRSPERSTYQFDLLTRLTDPDDPAFSNQPDGFHLAQDFYWYNPAKLPGPVEWVNVRKFRLTDAVTHIWWLAKEVNDDPALTNDLKQKLQLIESGIEANVSQEDAVTIVDAILKGSTPVGESDPYTKSVRATIQENLPDIADRIHETIASTNKAPRVFARRVLEAIETDDAIPYPRPKPEANNQRVLQEYSDSHEKLLETGEYNEGKRPSGWDIDENSFANRNAGAIPKNFIQAPNTASRTRYLRYCERFDFEKHPARFPPRLPEFFVNFLTPNPPYDDWDRSYLDRPVVLDIFAGSNVTGEVAQALGRYWIAFEEDEKYLKPSELRFMSEDEAIERFGHRQKEEQRQLNVNSEPE